MKKCEKCGVWVLDDTKTCPLCNRVLIEVGEEAEDKAEKKAPCYPAVDFDAGKFDLISRGFLLLLILVAVGLGVVNYLTYNGIVWSAAALVLIAYLGVTVFYSVMHRANLAAKILVQMAGFQVLTVVCDWVLGYNGWSVNYMVPGSILCANLAIVLLMIVNTMNWQSYFMYQISITIFALIPLVLCLLGVIAKPTFSLVSTGISVLILVITIVLGDKKVKNELIRRFHL